MDIFINWCKQEMLGSHFIIIFERLEFDSKFSWTRNPDDALRTKKKCVLFEARIDFVKLKNFQNIWRA